ncbi:hypothetical protein PVK63_09255 [Aliivibrio sp. S2TY2]|uniref:hypothetical protein n=1 Tax=unclassified Aliivibrio TaxID=2645654 RepID=UPI002378BEA7|nr:MULTISPECIES: hypothetical protein [unclassified Aliivibrio]MDD9174915.1 hypothetical protein [Aliivibrio sp. S3TY1]MDD9192138.1 hypothetical protein [Aliivibrio sp. S2TY2]
MNKMIPIGLFSTLLLTACGGDSGGGGGSPAPTKYTWQFVQMETRTKADMLEQCGVEPTIFNINKVDPEDVQTWKYTYALNAKKVRAILVYDENNDVVDDSTIDVNNISSKGVLTFTSNDVPKDWSIAIVDTSTSKDTHIFSIEGALLTDSIIKIQQAQGEESSCYTDNKLLVSSTSKNVTLKNNSSYTSSDTYFDGKSAIKPGSSQENLTVINAGEQVLFTGYNMNSYGDLVVNEFAYQDSKTLSTAGTTIELEKAEEQLVAYITNITNTEFNHLTIRSKYKNDTFDWFDWNAYADDFFVKIPASPTTSYTYSAKYEGTHKQWGVLDIKNIVGNTVDVDFDANLLNDTTPTVSCGYICEVNTIGLTYLDNIKASHITFTTGTTHYSMFSTKDQVLVPYVPVSLPIHIDEAKSGDEVTISLLNTVHTDKKLINSFITYGNGRNYTGDSLYAEAILPPALAYSELAELFNYEYTIVTR